MSEFWKSFLRKKLPVESLEPGRDLSGLRHSTLAKRIGNKVWEDKDGKTRSDGPVGPPF